MPWTDKSMLVSLLGATWAAGTIRIILHGKNLIVAYILVDVPPQFKGLSAKPKKSRKDMTTIFQVLRSDTIYNSVVQVLRELCHLIFVSFGLMVGYFPLLWSLTSLFSDSIAVQLSAFYCMDSTIAPLLMAFIGPEGDSGFLKTVRKCSYLIICNAACVVMLALSASYAPGGYRWVLVLAANALLRLIGFSIWNLKMMYWRRNHLKLLNDKNLNALTAEVGFPKDHVYFDPEEEMYPEANYYSVFGESWIVVNKEMLDFLSNDKEDCVVAHEFGHWKHRWSITHSMIRYVLPLVETMCLGYLCALAYGNGVLNEVFGFTEDVHPLLPMYLAYFYVWPIVNDAVHYLTSLLQRQSVFAADGFVLQQLGPKSVADIKVALFNVAGLAEKYPIFDNWYSGLVLGYPTILERLAHVDMGEYLNMLKKEGVAQLKQLI